MNKNYLPSLEEHFTQRPMCHRKIMFSRDSLWKCKALGKVGLEAPWDLGERDNSHEGRMPLQPGKVPTWTRGKRSISLKSNHRAAETGGPDSHQCPNPARLLTALLVNTIVLFWLCDLQASISAEAMEQENKDLKASSISVASSTLRMSVEQWRAGSLALELQFDVDFCCWLLTQGALLSWSWLTSALWLNAGMDSVTTTCTGFVVLPHLTSCFGNEFPQSVVILSGPS